MKKKLLLGVLIVLSLFMIVGCKKDLSKDVVGTWKQNDAKWFLVLYEGGTGKGYTDEEDFKKTGYAPQEYKWETKDDIINITNVLTNKTEGFVLEKDILKSVDGEKIFIRQ